MTLETLRRAIIASATLVAIALPAQAAEPAPEQETMCLAAYLAMAGETDPATANAGLMGALYYAGRVQGRPPDQDAIDLVVTLFSRPNAEAEIQAAMPICGRELQTLGQHWTERGAEMQRAAAAAAAAK